MRSRKPLWMPWPQFRTNPHLESWRVTHLGRNSALMQVFSSLGALSKEERPVVGQAANRVKVALEAALAEKTEAVKKVRSGAFIE